MNIPILKRKLLLRNGICYSKWMFGLFLLTVFINTIHAQSIVTLNKFEPYELIGDTLYFNRNGYDVVKVVEPVILEKEKAEEIIGYKAYYYVMINDSTDYSKMHLNRDRLFRGIEQAKEFKKYNCWAETDYGIDYNHINNTIIGRYLKILVTGKNCDWMPPFVEDSISEKYMKPYPYYSNSMSLRHIPGSEKTLDSISSLLNYRENSYYSIRINKFLNTEANITPTDLCSNFQYISIPNGSIDNLKTYLQNYPWPVFKAHNSIYPYDILYWASYSEVIGRRIEAEKMNGFANSINIFEKNDSIYALIDSFNLYTHIYTVRQKYGMLVHNIITEQTRVISFEASRYTDINNDNLKDLVIDTIQTGDNKQICYLPQKATIDGYTKWDYSKKILSYTYNLGNNSYYLLKTSKDRENASIIRFYNGESKTLVSYSRNPVKKKFISDKYRSYSGRRRSYHKITTIRTVGYTYYTEINKQKKVVKTTRNPEQAVKIKKEMIRLFQYYIDHPEKINEDFKLKK